MLAIAAVVGRDPLGRAQRLTAMRDDDAMPGRVRHPLFARLYAAAARASSAKAAPSTATRRSRGSAAA